MQRLVAGGSICFGPLISMAAWLTYVGRSLQYSGSPSFPGQGVDDHAALAAVVNYYRPTRLLSESDSPAAAGMQMSPDTTHGTCKYLNSIIEADHGALKRVVRRAVLIHGAQFP